MEKRKKILAKRKCKVCGDSMIVVMKEKNFSRNLLCSVCRRKAGCSSDVLLFIKKFKNVN